MRPLLHVHEFGDGGGPTLLCLHGLTGHGGRFRRLADVLGRRVIAPDLRGHGRSTWDPPWSTEQHVADVLGLLAQAGEPVDLLGFSYGGRIAAAVAAAPAASGALRRLILLDPALSLSPALAREHAEGALAEPESVPDVDAAVDERLAAGTLFSTPREVLAEDVAEHYARRPDGRLEIRVHRAMAVTAWSEMAREAPGRSSLPTLLITGERSWLPVDAGRLAPERHVVVPGGHSVLWDDFDAVARAVAGFLR